MKVNNKGHLPEDCLREKSFVGLTEARELIGSWGLGASDELSPATEHVLQGSREALQSSIHRFFSFLFFKSVILSLLKGNLGCGLRGPNKFCGSFVRVSCALFELRVGWQIPSADGG